MSTRGIWGYVIDGTEKLTYNHSDSYPDWLGERVLKHAAATDLGELREKVRALRVVTDADPVTEADIERLAEFAETIVSSGDLHEWYVLLRGTQGDPDATLRAGVIEDGHEFANDSLFCEWGYVIDLDAGRFEVYRGFARAPHSDGRFAVRVVEEHARDEMSYYPIRLIASWPLAELPESLDGTALSSHEED